MGRPLLSLKFTLSHRSLAMVSKIFTVFLPVCVTSGGFCSPSGGVVLRMTASLNGSSGGMLARDTVTPGMGLPSLSLRTSTRAPGFGSASFWQPARPTTIAALTPMTQLTHRLMQIGLAHLLIHEESLAFQ